MSTDLTLSMDYAEFAKLADVHVVSVRRWVSEGKLRSHRKGRKCYIFYGDARGFLEARGLSFQGPIATNTAELF